MEISGKIIKKFAPITGESKHGPWKKQNFVVETLESYPKKICFSVWNDKVELDSLTENDTVKIFFDIESREFNDNWYTDLKAWKAEVVKTGDNGFIEERPPLNDLEIPPELPEEDGDDLPF